MGNVFEIAIVSENKTWANTQIDLAIEEIRRIEKLLTTFSDNSVTHNINKNAGIQPVEVPREVFDLIFRCQKISVLTQGAFDISYGGLDKRFWNFDINMKTLPSVEKATKAVQFIDYQKIFLDEKNETVFLKEAGMRIGFGGIGKGYAADKTTQLLKKNGVMSGFVNAAGDLNTWGIQENGKPWTIGVADPSQSQKAFSSLDITNAAVATSGNYEKFVIIDGQRYSHTIDPKTGFPVSGIKSVTIITTNAELADALTTPIMVMGISAGLSLINQMKGVGCIIIDDHNKLFLSKNINIIHEKDIYNS
ncbi:MAG: FAD:protein transferase [Bacteroidota bacterium]|nr:FAD:protein transferase [Bacteroidota bacterium]